MHLLCPWNSLGRNIRVDCHCLIQGIKPGLPLPYPGDRPNPGIKPESSTLQADSLLSELSGKYCKSITVQYCITDRVSGGT